MTDVHAAHRGLESLLREVGAIDADGNRLDSHFVAQLGDLLHLGHQVHEADLRTLEVGLRWIDLFVLGNHEGFYTYRLESCWWSHILTPDRVHPEVIDRLSEMTAAGRWHIAAAIDGWVMSHAGIHPDYQKDLLDRAGSSEADAVVGALAALFADRLETGRRTPIIDSSGPVRGIDAEPGGVLWADFSEQEAAMDRNVLHQIVGHTPQARAPRLVGDRFWAADMGGGRTGTLGALVKGPDEEEWTPVVVSVPDPLVA